MTPQEAKKLLPVIQAFAEGKEVEAKCKRSTDDKWAPLRDSVWDIDYFDYRIKPESKYRPWRPEEVPVGCVLKVGGASSVYQPVDWENNCVTIYSTSLGGHSGHFYTHTYKQLCDDWVYSTDNGKTWQPCGILE